MCNQGKTREDKRQTDRQERDVLWDGPEYWRYGPAGCTLAFSSQRTRLSGFWGPTRQGFKWPTVPLFEYRPITDGGNPEQAHHRLDNGPHSLVAHTSTTGSHR